MQTPSQNYLFPPPAEQPFVDPVDNWMELDVSIDAFETSAPVTTRGKRKTSFSDDGERPIRPRTLGGDRPVELHVAKPIASWTPSHTGSIARVPTPWMGPSAGNKLELLLPLPPLLTYLSSEVEDVKERAVLEAKNMEATGIV